MKMGIWAAKTDTLRTIGAVVKKWLETIVGGPNLLIFWVIPYLVKILCGNNIADWLM